MIFSLESGQSICISILILLLIDSSFIFRSTDGNYTCEGPEKCCVGFMWDENKGKCVRCGLGYIGKFCNISCPWPTYGEGCQQRCSCSSESCHIAFGCILSINTTVTTYEVKTSETKSRTTSDYLENSRSTMHKTTYEKETLISKTNAGDIYTTLSKTLSSQKQAELRQATSSAPEKDVPPSSLTNPLLIGIFIFNAIFVITILCVALFFGFRKYKKSRKKRNRNLGVHYHEINDEDVTQENSYDPLATSNTIKGRPGRRGQSLMSCDRIINIDHSDTYTDAWRLSRRSDLEPIAETSESSNVEEVENTHPKTTGINNDTNESPYLTVVPT